MAFRDPPPQYYVPESNNTIPTVAFFIVVVIVIVVAVILYVAIKKATSTSCTSNLDCPSSAKKCQISSGLCLQCLSSADCSKGSYCSTNNTCL